MKLYATTTSNRATKGQGGDYLDISITNDKKLEIANIEIKPLENETNDYSVYLWLKGNTNMANTYIIKGEKQKGDFGIYITKDKGFDDNE